MDELSKEDLRKIIENLPGKEDSSNLNFKKWDERIVFSESSPEEIADSWRGGFTDPKEHNYDNFCYLIHAFQGSTGEIIQKLVAIDALKKGEGDIQQFIDLLEEPHRIADKKIVSASVIDQNHTATFGECGLILKTPPENVLAAFSEDTGTKFVDPDKVIESSKRNLCTVDELMKATKPDQYNEVQILGNTRQGKMEIIGFWIKVDEEGEPLDSETAQKVSNLAKWDKMPLVRITEKKTKIDYPDTKPEIHTIPLSVQEGGKPKAVEIPFAFSIQRGGLRYWLNFNGGDFQVFSPGSGSEIKSRTMTPEEFNFAKGILEEELDQESKEKYKDIIDNLSSQFAQRSEKTS